MVKTIAREPLVRHPRKSKTPCSLLSGFASGGFFANPGTLFETNNYKFSFKLDEPLIKEGFMESYIGVYCSVNVLLQYFQSNFQLAR